MGIREDAELLREQRRQKTLDNEHLKIPSVKGRINKIDTEMMDVVSSFLNSERDKVEDLKPLEGFEDLAACPNCNSGEFHYHGYEKDDGGDVWRCQNCGFQWLGVDAVTPDMIKRLGIRPIWGSNENYKH